MWEFLIHYSTISSTSFFLIISSLQTNLSNPNVTNESIVWQILLILWKICGNQFFQVCGKKFGDCLSMKLPRATVSLSLLTRQSIKVPRSPQMFFIRSSGLGPLGLQTTQVFFSNLTNDFVSLSLKKKGWHWKAKNRRTLSLRNLKWFSNYHWFWRTFKGGNFKHGKLL